MSVLLAPLPGSALLDSINLSALAESWPAAFWTGVAPEEAPILIDVSRWWVIVFAIDTAWSTYAAFSGEPVRTGGG